MSPSASDTAVAPATTQIEFDDPHAHATCRKPKSRGCARCAAPGAGRWWSRPRSTILLCINQQFSLRFFIGYTQLNTEYFYLLIALMLPFTFLIFPGTGERAARPHSLV